MLEIKKKNCGGMDKIEIDVKYTRPSGIQHAT